MNDHGHHDSNDRKRDVVKNRVEEHVEHHRVWHHRRLAENADQPGAENARCMKRFPGDDVDDREPHHDCSGSNDSGVNSLTYGIVPFSHRSSSKGVLLA